MWNFLKRLLARLVGRVDVEPVPIPAEPVVVPVEAVAVEAPVAPEPVVVQEAPESLPGSDLHREKSFNHTKTRVRERYGFTLTRSMWDRWNELIATQDPHALLLRDTADSLWRVSFGPVDVFVVYQHGFVTTALSRVPHFAQMVWEALERRRAARPPMPLKTGKTTSRTVGHGNLDKPKPRLPKEQKAVPEKPKAPVLPPVHLRPKRDEAVLRRLRAEAAGKKSVD